MLGRSMGRTSEDAPFAVEFGLRVRARRTELGWTQQQLAERTGLHFTYVSSVERGQRNVTLRTVVRLAEAMAVNPAWLVDQLRWT